MVKIADLPDQVIQCSNTEHDPPSVIIEESGVFEHTCPECGWRTQKVLRQRAFRTGNMARAINDINVLNRTIHLTPPTVTFQDQDIYNRQARGTR